MRAAQPGDLHVELREPLASPCRSPRRRARARRSCARRRPPMPVSPTPHPTRSRARVEQALEPALVGRELSAQHRAPARTRDEPAQLRVGFFEVAAREIDVRAQDPGFVLVAVVHAERLELVRAARAPPRSPSSRNEWSPTRRALRRGDRSPAGRGSSSSARRRSGTARAPHGPARAARDRARRRSARRQRTAPSSRSAPDRPPCRRGSRPSLRCPRSTSMSPERYVACAQKRDFCGDLRVRERTRRRDRRRARAARPFRYAISPRVSSGWPAAGTALKSSRMGAMTSVSSAISASLRTARRA